MVEFVLDLLRVVLDYYCPFGTFQTSPLSSAGPVSFYRFTASHESSVAHLWGDFGELLRVVPTQLITATLYAHLGPIFYDHLGQMFYDFVIGSNSTNYDRRVQ